MTDSQIEQVRALINSPGWESMTPQAQYAALQAISSEADDYTVSYLSGDGTQHAHEHFPLLDEALDRAHAIYNGAVPLYAGSYVDVIDLGGESYTSLYAI